MTTKEIIQCCIDKIAKGQWGTGDTDIYAPDEHKDMVLKAHCAVGLVSACIKGEDFIGREWVVSKSQKAGYPSQFVSKTNGDEKSVVAKATMKALYNAIPKSYWADECKRSREGQPNPNASYEQMETWIVNYNDSLTDDSKGKTRIKKLFTKALETV